MNPSPWCSGATHRRFLTTVTGPLATLMCRCVTVPRQRHRYGIRICSTALPSVATPVRPLTYVFATVASAPGTAKVPGIACQRPTDTSSIAVVLGTAGPGLLSTTMVAKANSSMTRMVVRNSSRSERGASRHIQRRYCTIGRSVKGRWFRLRRAAPTRSARRTPA